MKGIKTMEIKVMCPTCKPDERIPLFVDSELKMTRCPFGHKFPVSLGKDIAKTVKL